MKKKNITIYDVAKVANVSPTTVSRVLTRSPLVKESTRRRVLGKMEELDFSPNEAARSLTTNQTNMIGFILPDITNPFFSQTYIDVETKAREKGYTVLLRNSMSRSEMESAHLRELAERRVECIVFMGGRINKVNPPIKEIEEMLEVIKKVPIIMVNGEMKGIDSHIIRTDEEEGIRSIVSHLVSQGHKKISMIGGAKGISSTDIKVETLQKELKKYHLDYNDNWQIYSGFGIEDGREAMEQLLLEDSHPTAIIGINDMVIYGALKECREQNVPISNFSFVGFDDIFPSDIVHPSLTSVNHNYDLLGTEIVQSLSKIIEKEHLEKEILIDTRLIIRESSQSKL
ncbi:LacI family DNA-binding transcriptional regulator [Lederbergia lenta]|uniref:Transcriptional regulator n=1 Tax=Lederbergia lenta TaxID=1467 RepID=A0A2X4WBR7_LEDLE|nr:LacI family DNA-binding transcriptional regulator [Lederbergia lenta]MCM3111826.1 LacI family transcriptional regulator [Lederbergia lenta]MEC2322980.1 LacI family DNA-binding transcriptional regulator [Lederbergia lenta]SQI62147.1 transcriptional regulator [Lederbergia lenta]